MEDYLRSLNPTSQGIIYGKKYHLWRNGEYLGVATWAEDENIGDSFQGQEVSDSGEIMNLVYIADAWKMV